MSNTEKMKAYNEEKFRRNSTAPLSKEELGEGVGGEVKAVEG